MVARSHQPRVSLPRRTIHFRAHLKLPTSRSGTRGGTSAVDHISIEVEPGEAMGLGGLNGASKTAEPFGPARFVSFFRLRASEFDLGTVSRFTNNFGRSSDRI